jgi:hypothetical protein
MDTPLSPAILCVDLRMLLYIYTCVCVCLYLHIWLRNILVSTYYHGTNVLGSRLPECPMIH